jgi:hypothetical protein
MPNYLSCVGHPLERINRTVWDEPGVPAPIRRRRAHSQGGEALPYRCPFCVVIAAFGTSVLVGHA